MTMCPESESAHRYVAGGLSTGDAERFERHLLGCEHCRREVDLALRFAPVLAEPAATDRRIPERPGVHDGPNPAGLLVTAGRGTGRRRPRWLLAAGLPIAAIAAVLTIVVARSRAELEELAGVTPPAFSGAPSRSLEETRQVDDGMRAYASGDYARAAALLGQATTSDSSPPVWFYLGVSRLATRDARGALEALAIPRGLVGSAYHDDALFFAAKAHLRLGNADSALTILRSIQPGSATASHAIALAESLATRRP